MLLDIKGTSAALAAAIFFGVGSAANAGGVSSLTAPNDIIDFAQLAPGTALTSPQSVTSAGGLGATASTAGNSFETLVQGSVTTIWNGNFALGTTVLWDSGIGPDLTLTFAQPVLGAGAQIQANSYGAFTAQIVVNGDTAHAYTENGTSNGNADNSAIFIGWDGGPINTISFSLTGAANAPEDFAIGPVSLEVGPAPGPIPGAGLLSYIVLGALGFGSMGWKRRRLRT